MDTTRLIERTHRVPRTTTSHDPGAAAGVARQLDAVLATAGFCCSAELLKHLADLSVGDALDVGLLVLNAARRMVGDHVEHNAYFRNFPFGVPDTMEFWVECLRKAVMAGAELSAPYTGVLNLLELPTYGSYQHTFAELAAAHDELAVAAGDRLTILHLGGELEAEKQALFEQLAGSPVPLTPGDRELLAALGSAVPDAVAELAEIPVRENRAIIDAARLAWGSPLVLAATVTDVLRVAVAACGGDVTLETRPRFTSLPRHQRWMLMAALEGIVKRNPDALRDVGARREVWKRLGERLHPHEYSAFGHARQVFEVARGQREARSLVSLAEAAAATDPGQAARVLAAAPGVLARWLDRLLRTCEPGTGQSGVVLEQFANAAPSVSGRVLLSLRDHIVNRGKADERRVFANRASRAHVEPDHRPALSPTAIAIVCRIIDDQIASRLPAIEHLVIDPAVRDVALPLSGKAAADGFAILPRGTTTALPPGDTLRFFTYWRQTEQRTDFDLSLLMLDSKFRHAGQVSFTSLHDGSVVHSGDITNAPDGATEFIDVRMPDVGATYLVPQVNIYSGEGFDEVAESLFGWMVRDRAQAGMPFEARTVRARSELRGQGRVAIPAVFRRDVDGWRVTWLHLMLRGRASFNMVEGSGITTADLVRGIVGRKYLTMGYLLDMLAAKAGRVTVTDATSVELDGPVVYVGLNRPDGIPAGSWIHTLGNLGEMVPR